MLCFRVPSWNSVVVHFLEWRGPLPVPLPVVSRPWTVSLCFVKVWWDLKPMSAFSLNSSSHWANKQAMVLRASEFATTELFALCDFLYKTLVSFLEPLGIIPWVHYFGNCCVPVIPQCFLFRDLRALHFASVTHRFTIAFAEEADSFCLPWSALLPFILSSSIMREQTKTAFPIYQYAFIYIRYKVTVMLCEHVSHTRTST